MPPLRRVISCSPSARARTVTAHSLKAVGIEERDSTVLVRTGQIRRSRGAGGRILRIGLRISSRFFRQSSGGGFLHHLHDRSKVLLSQAFSVGSRVRLL